MLNSLANNADSCSINTDSSLSSIEYSPPSTNCSLSSMPLSTTNETSLSLNINSSIAPMNSTVIVSSSSSTSSSSLSSSMVASSTMIKTKPSTSPQPKPSRKIVKPKRSLVWRYFNVLQHSVLNVKCLLCASIVIRKSTSTSSLLHHLQIQHSAEYQTLIRSMKSITGTSNATTRLPLTCDRSIFLTKLIADLIIHNFLPLSIVESSHLQTIFQELEPSYIIPQRKYFLKNVLNEMYTELKQSIYNELQLASAVCLTTDIWTSQCNQSYITVTAHIVDLNENKIKHFVLETTEFSGNHAAQRIVERLDEICIEWAIAHKVVRIVSDTCNTMRRTGLDFKKGLIIIQLPMEKYSS
ncbi:unnamed protein product [Rotaria magnacalcarata]|uniref:BED-type domain-containing protein n=2 Tax=Rotaria magnacalcarata TaxID=392030 RepID=A0A820GUQ2_9BILA|nr:unnamed protein product [Rotaria magnacalcarata]CAF2138265.1 unnamed protein product [Rotaria magnacalcarata]CAF4282956.1 unnamed protein product [Rotaria magnacalcarata]CAF4291750.1 unnamed protein product [Rotaria magnacalcarata]